MEHGRLKELLEYEAAARNCEGELCESRPDPLMVARRYPDELHALTCALFAYGSAKAIVTFTASLEPSYVLRAPDEASRRQAYRVIVEGLRQALTLPQG